MKYLVFPYRHHVIPFLCCISYKMRYKQYQYFYITSIHNRKRNAITNAMSKQDIPIFTLFSCHVFCLHEVITNKMTHNYFNDVCYHSVSSINLFNMNKKSIADSRIKLNSRKPCQSYTNDTNDNTGTPNMTVVTTTAPITSNIAFILFLLQHHQGFL